MYELKAFVTNELLIDNFIKSVSSIGELSPYALTYAREKQYYSVNEKPALQLVVFSTTNNNGYVEVQTGVKDKVLQISDWVYNATSSGTVGIDVDDYKESFISFWGDEVILEEVGDLVQKYIQTTLKVYPSYLVFSFKTLINEDNQIRIWFSSEAFESQYENYEVLAVDIVDNLDIYFTGYNAVKELAAATSFSDIIEDVEKITNKYPYTKLRADIFEYVNPLNKDQKVPIYWPTIIYGKYGDNLQVIKEVLVDHILKNSTHTRAEWATIFPELFSTTEFVIIPFFNHYAIPNLSLTSGLYRACVSISDILNTITKGVKGVGYTESYILENVSVLGTLYKSVLVASVGGYKNLNNINKLEDQFKDLILVPSTHPDFQRMSKTTREFILFLIDLIVEAEKATPYNTISTQAIRIERDNLLYVSAAYKKIQYYVLTKYSMQNTANQFIKRP